MSPKWVSCSTQITYVVVSFLLSVNLFSVGAVDADFLGADKNKVEEPPKYLKICHRSDKKLDKCIKSSIEKFLEVVSSDSLHLNLPNLDPIELPSLEFQLGSGNVSLHMTFKDFRIKGFKNFTVTNVKSNIIDNKFEISVENPFIIMAAQFSAAGGIYTFPILGQGDFHLNLTDVSAVFIFRLTTVNVLPRLNFLTVEDVLIDLVSSDINGHFGDFIDGSNVIGMMSPKTGLQAITNCCDSLNRQKLNKTWISGTAFNTFFNHNAHEIFAMIKPKLSKTLAGIFGAIANEILSRHPENVLLPD